MVITLTSCSNDIPGFEVKGKSDYMGGTGKYKGITGKNAYRIVGWGAGRAVFNDAQPRKVPVLGGARLLGGPDLGRGPDYDQHLFGGMRALGWNDNYIPISLAGIPGDESMAHAARTLVAQNPAAIAAFADAPTRTARVATRILLSDLAGTSDGRKDEPRVSPKAQSQNCPPCGSFEKSPAS
jgi:hypothetical protein